MDFEIIIQECFSGDFLPKLLKPFRSVEQNGRQFLIFVIRVSYLSLIFPLFFLFFLFYLFINLFYFRSSFVHFKLDLVLSVAWSFGVQLVVFRCSGISVLLFHTLGFSKCHNTFLLSPHF